MDLFLVSGTNKTTNTENIIRKFPYIKKVYAGLAVFMTGNKYVTRVLLAQLPEIAIAIALLLALDAKNSLVINHGMGPGPIAKNT